MLYINFINITQMTDQRQQPFRFRLPWLAPQRPAPQPQRPRATSQSTTSVPIQRPTFSSARIAPTQPSPQQSLPVSKAEPRPPTTAETPPTVTAKPPSPPSFVDNKSLKVSNQTASTSSSPNNKPQSPPKSTTQSTSSPSSTTRKPPSPISVTMESPTSKPAATPKPSPPSRVGNNSPKTTQNSPTKPSVQSTTTAKPPQSPSLGRPQSKVATSATSSPPKGDSKSSTASNSSIPQSPSRLVSTPRRTTQKEPQTKVDVVSRSPSSPAKPQNQGASKPPPTSTEKATSQAPLQESELKVVITSETTSKLTLEDDAIAEGGREGLRQANATLNPEEIKAEPATPEKLNSSSVLVEDQKSTRGESMGVVGEPQNEEKNSSTPIYKETVQKIITDTPGLVQTQQKREISEIKEALSTTSNIGKRIKTVSPSHPIEDAAPKRREINEDISRLVRKITIGLQFDEKQVVVITLTGENRGASMLLSSEQAKKESSIHIHRGYKIDPAESLESATDGESSATKGKKLDNKVAPTAMASVNSNVQSINNSIVVEASVTGKDPGVHLVLSQNNSETAKANVKSEFMDTRKAEFTTSSSEKLTHEPTVRRRCLRGLFLESSDSEPENPNKPRRHGCRYNCTEKSTDKRVHVH